MIREPTLIALLRAEGANLGDPRLLAMMVASGISGAGAIAVLSSASAEADTRAPHVLAFLLFTALLLVQVVASRYSLRTVCERVEGAVHRLRERLVDKLRHASLARLERVGHGSLYSAIGKETQVISQLAFVLAGAVQSLVLVMFGGLYLAWLSPIAFGVSVAVLGVAIAVYQLKSRVVRRAYEQAMVREGDLFDRIADFVDGFKEVRMRRSRSNDMFEHFRDESRLAMTHRIEAGHALSGQSVFGQTTMFLLVGAIVFVVPAIAPSFGSQLAQIAGVVLFLFGSITAVVGTLPASAAASAAAESLSRLETSLDAAVLDEGAEAGEGAPAFESLRLTGVQFRHVDAAGRDAFVLGPLDFELRAGEIVFLSGGNGAGKTTLLKLLVGLYTPEAGRIELNGQPLASPGGQAYRELFSVVFNDYHLFRRLYGLPGATPERVREILELLEIADKTSVSDGRFETLSLSGGQRKRLALLVALLEDRPILVLDEWAADQDPPFRRKFYRELLPRLRDEGKTIVAITHDDAYFDAADRRVPLDYGRIARA